MTAYRLAEGGLRVCLLERGKAYPPGSFAAHALRHGAELLGPERGQARDVRPLDLQGARGARLERARRRLADLRERADPQGRRVVRQRGGRGLAGDARRPRSALRPRRADARAAALPVRRRAVRVDAEDAGDAVCVTRSSALDWNLPDLAVTFGNPGQRRGRAIRSSTATTSTALPRFTCRLCGECDIGCNYGSKNTLDFNYLTAFERRAARSGRAPRCARSRPTDGGGFVVHYVTHEPEREGERTDTSRAAGADDDVRAARALRGRVRHAVPAAAQRATRFPRCRGRRSARGSAATATSSRS